ncbi:MAG: polymer-forming cytoskeletal protein [Elusimicrobiales bacterium]|nr:polymer-forming cytoskeletal protein [Elusimicrobiales bacterium]
MSVFKDKISELTVSESVITEDCTFIGNINTKGSIKVEGVVEGNITSSKEVFVTKTARVNGDIVCGRCVVYGNINGNIIASNSVEIMSIGCVNGDIRTSRIMIEDGAYICGNIDMKKEKV